MHDANQPHQYPIDANDICDENEARAITRCSNHRTWKSWHDRDVIRWFRAPGTRKRLYSRAWLTQWIASGACGAAAAGVSQ